MELRLPPNAKLTKAGFNVSPIRVITLRAFYRRLTRPERKILRESTDDAVADLREDLMRSTKVDLDDAVFVGLLNETPLSPARIAALLVDGTRSET